MKDIHITDLQTFTTCRRRWDWESLLRQGLQRAAIPAPLFLGQGVHVALEAYHKSCNDVSQALETFGQWVTKRAEAAQRYQRYSILREADRQMMDEMRELGTAMLEHYHLWCQSRDDLSNFEYLGGEVKFAVPIPLPPEVVTGRGYRELSRIATQHPQLGWVSDKIQLVGRLDGLVKVRQTGMVKPLEFKTTKTLSNPAWMMRSMQSSAYVFAARTLFDADNSIVYRLLRKKGPAAPKPLKTGGYSQAKNQTTSFEHFRSKLDEEAERRGIEPVVLYRENRKILEHLRTQPENFFMERTLHKTEAAVSNAMRTIYFEGMRMVDPNTPIFGNPSWFHCNMCQFKDVCDLREHGMEESARELLAAEFAPRGYWEGKA